mmetsp:Transcript_14394/g.20216  ORF Transcript_14394/g.20216 Transcript_14394/m.20216 type:complete len:178 (+) Transcript_14394:1316-1849(+)
MAFVPWQRHVIHVLQTAVCVLLFVEMGIAMIWQERIATTVLRIVGLAAEMDIVMMWRERIATTVPRIVVLAAEMEVVIQNTEKLVHRVQLTVVLVLLRMVTCAAHQTQRTVWTVIGATRMKRIVQAVGMQSGWKKEAVMVLESGKHVPTTKVLAVGHYHVKVISIMPSAFREHHITV